MFLSTNIRFVPSSSRAQSGPSGHVVRRLLHPRTTAMPRHGNPRRYRSFWRICHRTAGISWDFGTGQSCKSGDGQVLFTSKGGFFLTDGQGPSDTCLIWSLQHEVKKSGDGCLEIGIAIEFRFKLTLYILTCLCWEHEVLSHGRHFFQRRLQTLSTCLVTICDSKYCIWRTMKSSPAALCKGGGTGFDETTCLGSAHGAWRLWLLHLRTCVGMPSETTKNTRKPWEMVTSLFCGNYCSFIMFYYVLLCFIMFYYVLLTWLVGLVGLNRVE